MENLNDDMIELYPPSDLPQEDTDKSLYKVSFGFMIVAMISAAIVALYFGILAHHYRADKAMKTLYIIAMVIALISYAWNVPFTVGIRKCIKTNHAPSIAFGVCVLIFGNLISGILVLVASSTQPSQTRRY